MKFPEIDKLYMYKPPTAHTLEILVNRTVRAVKPYRFNDPFDCALEFSKEFFREQVMRDYESGEAPQTLQQFLLRHGIGELFDEQGKTTNHFDKIYDQLANRVHEINQSVGVVCFSERFDSVLMWSHYARDHNGICLEFARLSCNWLGQDKDCSKVEYSHDYPNVDLFTVVTQPTDQTVTELLRTKAIDWNYEREWRLINLEGDVNIKWPGEITKVILGIRIDQEFKQEVEQLCEKMEIECVQATKGDLSFAIGL